MRKKLFLLSFCTLLAFAVQANAYSVSYLTTSGTNTLEEASKFGNQTNQNAIDNIILPYIAPATELYKSNVGGVEEGSLAGSYITTYGNTPSNPSDAIIKYDGSGLYVGPIAWLLVKDGAQKPAWYLFELTGWDGKQELILSGFWPGPGAISHVALYGTPVPIPAAAWMLGSGLIGLVVIRRRIKK